MILSDSSGNWHTRIRRVIGEPSEKALASWGPLPSSNNARFRKLSGVVNLNVVIPKSSSIKLGEDKFKENQILSAQL